MQRRKRQFNQCGADDDLPACDADDMDVKDDDGDDGDGMDVTPDGNVTNFDDGVVAELAPKRNARKADPMLQIVALDCIPDSAAMSVVVGPYGVAWITDAVTVSVMSVAGTTQQTIQIQDGIAWIRACNVGVVIGTASDAVVLVFAVDNGTAWHATLLPTLAASATLAAYVHPSFETVTAVIHVYGMPVVQVVNVSLVNPAASATPVCALRLPSIQDRDRPVVAVATTHGVAVTTTEHILFTTYAGTQCAFALNGLCSNRLTGSDDVVVLDNAVYRFAASDSGGDNSVVAFVGVFAGFETLTCGPGLVVAGVIDDTVHVHSVPPAASMMMSPPTGGDELVTATQWPGVRVKLPLPADAAAVGSSGICRVPRFVWPTAVSGIFVLQDTDRKCSMLVMST